MMVGSMAKDMLLHTMATVLRQQSEADGVIEAVVGSSNVVDRMGEVIDQDGWLLDNYIEKNPVILWGHNVKEERPPIGKALKVWLDGKQKKTKKLMFKIQFDLLDEFAASIYRKVKDGFINTVSVGFMPLEWEDNTYIKQELLELSFVPVPANPEAVVVLRGMGIEPVEVDKLYEQKEEPVREEVDEEEAKEEPEEAVVSEEAVPEGEEKVETEEQEVTEESEAEGEESPAGDDEAGKEPKEAEEKAQVVSKGVIPFRDYGTAPESEDWDGPGEVSRAEVGDLKKICTWFDSEDSDVKSGYKLPHHKAVGYKAVWRGVAAAMAALLGARGGVKIPDGDRKGVYNHLAKHYEQFDKEAPDFKMVEGQVLANLDEEIHALTLEREDKYTVRLIKKLIEMNKEEKKKEEKKVKGVSKKEVTEALKVLELAVSLISSSTRKEV